APHGNHGSRDSSRDPLQRNSFTPPALSKGTTVTTLPSMQGKGASFSQQFLKSYDFYCTM
ncbi:hypothetical protein, partial [Selenomonas bovis]|uniref:hypothetical protein n=1 Tax=Selenomonas bovis TaxID=416586 RepID=UPI001E6565A4